MGLFIISILKIKIFQKKKSGKPYLTLSNNLKNILKRKLNLKKFKIFLSLSDEREYSVAYVITQKIK